MDLTRIRDFLFKAEEDRSYRMVNEALNGATLTQVTKNEKLKS